MPGTLEEVMGPGAPGKDIENRTIGICRAAALESDGIDDRTDAALEVYARGVSYRLFVDFSEPANARAASPATQSGQPGGPHYADRLQETLDHRYPPLLIDLSDIEAEAEHQFFAPAYGCAPSASIAVGPLNAERNGGGPG